MRILIKTIILSILTPFPALAQVPSPQIPLTGTPGSAGNFPFLPNGSFAMPSDANYTVTYPNTSCVICVVTSGVSLTATRNLVEPGPGSPVAKMTFNITNSTTGGQSIQVIASSGSGVTIANGTSKWVYFNGTNYVEIDPPASGGSPGGSNHAVQFNAASSFGGTAFTGILKASTTADPAAAVAADLSAIGGCTGLAAVGPCLSVGRQNQANFFQRQHTCGGVNQACAINVFGDSLQICWGFPNGNFNCSATVGPLNSINRQIEQLRTKLQDLLGYHGPGFSPVISDISGGTLNSDFFTHTGSYSLDGFYGPSQTTAGGTGGTILLGTGATVTYDTTGTLGSQTGVQLPFDTLYVACNDSPAVSATMTMTIDGSTVSSPALCGNAGSPAARMIAFTGLTNTTHTVVITCPTTPCAFAGAGGTSGNHGVEINNLSTGTATSQWYGANPSTNFAYIDQWPDPVLLVLDAFGGDNDSQQGITTTQFATATNALITHEQALASAPSVGLIATPITNVSGAATNYPLYAAQQLILAKTFNTMYIDPKDQWGPTYSNALGLFNASGPNVGLHFSDIGTLSIAAQYWTGFFDNFAPPAPARLEGIDLAIGQPYLLGTPYLPGAFVHSVSSKNASFSAGVRFDDTCTCWIATATTGFINAMGATSGQEDFYTTTGVVGKVATLTKIGSMLANGNFAWGTSSQFAVTNGGLTTAPSFNGVALTAAGSTSLFLNQAGGYTTPAGGGNVSTSGTTTTGFCPLFSGTTTITNALCDYGVTTASKFTFGTGVNINDASGLGGGFDNLEGTAHTGASGSDDIWADSTAHRWKMNNNNAGALIISGIASAGTAAHCVQLAANGIDLADSGSACGSGSITLASVAAGTAPTSSGTYNFANNNISTTGQVSTNTLISTAQATLTGGTNQFAVSSAGIEFLGSPFNAAPSNATSGANVNSGSYSWEPSYWDGTTHQVDTWTSIGVMGTGTNPTSTLTFAHSGTSGVAKVAMAALAVTGITGSTQCVQADTNGNLSGTGSTCGSGGGSVTSVSGDGTLITNSASTGGVTLTLGTAAAHKFFGNNTGSTAAPGYQSIGVSDWTINANVTGAGLVNVLTATMSPAATALTTGLQVWVLPNLANTTTTPTLNVNGLGAVTITKSISGTISALVANDYVTTLAAHFFYDGTEWVLLNPQAGGSGVTSVSGTTNQINSTGGTTPVLSLSSTIAIPGTLSSATNGAASSSAVTMTGNPFQGTGTTSTPLLYLNNGTAPSSFITTGTYFGINSSSGFGGAYIDIHGNGGSSLFFLGAGGALSFHNMSQTAGGTFTVSTSGATNALIYQSTIATITASSTPAINVSLGSLQTITLSANSTPTVTGIVTGLRVTFQICQPVSGGPFTWTWPATIHGGMTIGTTASTCSMQSFNSFNATTLVPESAGVINIAP